MFPVSRLALAIFLLLLLTLPLATAMIRRRFDYPPPFLSLYRIDVMSVSGQEFPVEESSYLIHGHVYEGWRGRSILERLELVLMCRFELYQEGLRVPLKRWLKYDRERDEFYSVYWAQYPGNYFQRGTYRFRGRWIESENMYTVDVQVRFK